MENPASWTEVERTIYQALKEHRDAVSSGIYGESEVLTVANALRQKNLIVELTEAQTSPTPYDFFKNDSDFEEVVEVVPVTPYDLGLVEE